MNYIGSKNKLSGFIKSNIINVAGDHIKDKIFCDLFAGTGIVGRNFKREVKQIISNDLEYYSFVLNKNYIGNTSYKKVNFDMIRELDQLAGVPGFIFKNYSKGGHGERQYFSDENASRIDAIRIKIGTLKEEGEISKDTYYFLLASLIECADKVANTASVYGAYLKKVKETAAKPLKLIPADFGESDQKNLIYNSDSNKLIHTIKGDILYLDPPYNSRQYGANYHILNTIAIYDQFVPKGKTGLRPYNRSAYCNKKNILTTFDELIRSANFKYIFLSYNNEGLMSVNEIKEIMGRYGHYDLLTKKYRRFKADKTENRNHKAEDTREYLHCLEKY